MGLPSYTHLWEGGRINRLEGVRQLILGRFETLLSKQ